MNNQDKKTILTVLFALGAFSLITILIAYFVATRRAPTAPVSKPAAGAACYLEFFFPSPTPTPTSTLTPTPTSTSTPTPTPTNTITPTPTTTPTIIPTPVPHECGYTPCDTTDNPCNVDQDLVCVQNQQDNLYYCAKSEFMNTCQVATTPGAAVCCYPPTPTPTTTSTPTPTPTATPTVTNTPTPTPAPVCGNLAADRTLGAEGESLILLTCHKTASYTGAVAYDFMLIHKESKESPDPVPTPTPFVRDESDGVTTYTIAADKYGYYLFMCRVCAGDYCTAWQR